MSVPSTPTGGGRHSEINEIVRSLNSKYHFGLPIRSEKISPNKIPNDDRNLLFEHIKILYWSSRSELHQTLDRFEAQVGPVPDSDRLPYLIRLINEARPSGLSSARRRPQEASKLARTSFNERLRTEPKVLSELSHEGPVSSSHTPLKAPSEALLPGNARSTFWEEDEFLTPPQSPTQVALDLAKKGSNERHGRRNTGNRSENEQFRSRKRPSDTGYPRLPSPKFHKGRDGSRKSGSSTDFYSASQTPVDGEPWQVSWSQETKVPSAETSFASTVQDGLAAKSANTSFTSVGTEAAPDPEKYDMSSTSDSIALSWPESELLHQLVRAHEIPPPPVRRHDQHSSGTLSWDTETRNEASSLLDRAEHAATPTKPMEHLSLETPHQHQADNRGVAMHHLVRDLPNSGLFLQGSQTIVSDFPFRVRYECARVALVNGISLDAALPSDNTPILDYEMMWTHIESLKKRSPDIKLPRRGPAKAWLSAIGDFGGISLNGRLIMNKLGSGSLFSLALEPLDFDNTCRFQRAYGGDRFLYLKVPRLNRLPPFLRGQENHVRSKLLEWLSVEKRFLGRFWRVFHIEPYKAKKTGRRLEREKEFQYRIILFATRGSDIPTKMATLQSSSAHYSSKAETSVEELVRWFMPVDKVLCQSFCKAYARLDLGFSRTIPTIVFRPDQVRRASDILADGSLEDTIFDDPDFDWQSARQQNFTRVMNDGCSRISLGACRLIWQKLGSDGPIPSAFQARINGAKGVWIRSAPSDSTFADDNDIWIEISDSQRKYPPHDEDTAASFDPHRWTFEVVKYTKKTTPYVLHLAFIPILTNRGVLEDKLEELTREVLDEEREGLLGSLEKAIALRCWISTHYSMYEERQRNQGLQWQAGLPLATIEKVNLLLESGFEPTKLPYLGDLVVRLTKDYFSKVVRSISIRVNRSTNVIGIADPIGVLEPGEIHMAFSHPMVDESSGEITSFLKDQAAVVTRHPCLRISDIQKVRAVYRHELSHLVDCVVFPSKGCIPLASKLQGGDYDGDTFWVCWEDGIVHSFQNAPPCLDPPPPEELGIQVEQRKLYEVLPVDNWLEESFAFRCAPDMLGNCTVDHEKQSYAENNVDAAGVKLLADLHDYLIDAAKGGYKFDEAAYKYFLLDPRIRYKGLAVPAYKDAMENGILSISGLKPKSRSPEKETKTASRRNLDHVVDRLFFTVIEPHINKTVRLITEEFLSSQAPWDAELYEVYRREREWGTDDRIITEEFSSLNQSLKSVYDLWIRSFTGRTIRDADAPFEDPDLYNEVLDECFTLYRNLQPLNSSHPVVSRWSRVQVGEGPTPWSLLKASALFKLFHERSAFTFHIAGRELAYIKAVSNPQPRLMIEQFWAQMKPRKYHRSAVEVAGIEAAQMARDRSWKTESSEVSHDMETSGDDSSAEDDFYSVVGSQAQDCE